MRLQGGRPDLVPEVGMCEVMRSVDGLLEAVLTVGAVAAVGFSVAVPHDVPADLTRGGAACFIRRPEVEHPQLAGC